MGFMDKLGTVFGGDKKAATDTVKGPSATLREHGIDPSNLKFGFNQDGSVTVSGHDWKVRTRYSRGRNW